MNRFYISTLLFLSASFASEAIEIPKTSFDEGGCYDLQTHQCGCQDDRCSKEKCEENGMIWTSQCPDFCDAEECEANDDDYEEGACYDPTVHSCGCEEDRCTKDKCEDLDMIWSSQCSVTCNTTDCINVNMTNYSEGACYDPMTHSCGCDDDRCSEEKCEELNMIWSTDCSVTCNATECYSGFDDYDGSACYNPISHSCGCDDDRCSQELCENVGMIWSPECAIACNVTECRENIDDVVEDDEVDSGDDDDEDESDDILDPLVSLAEGIISVIVALCA